MPKGYRRIILATLGWLILSAQNNPTNDSPQPKRPINSQRGGDEQKAADTIASAIRDTIQPAEQDRGCDNGRDQRQSELCAQWKAADAAASATIAAWIIGALGILIGGATFVAAIKAALYARDAAIYTNDSNGIARDEQRPWLAIKAIPQKIISKNGAVRFDFTIYICNLGKTIAQNVDMRHTILDGHDDMGDMIEDHIAIWNDDKREMLACIVPGENVQANLFSIQSMSNFKTEQHGALIYPTLLVYVRYRVHNSGEDKVTQRVFRFAERRDRATDLLDDVTIDHCIRTDEGTQKADRLTLESFGGIAT